MLLFLFVLRLIMRANGAGKVIAAVGSAEWHSAEWLPSFFVMRSSEGKTFFNAGVGITAIAALELLLITKSSKSKALKWFAGALALALVGYQVVLALAMRSSWSFDILVALFLARYCSIIAERYSPWFDALMPQ